MLEPQFISPPFSNTWLLKSWNSQVTLPRTTRRPESSQDTFSWPSETTRNSTSSCPTPPLLKEVSSPTSADQFTTESNHQENQAKLYDLLFLYFSSFSFLFQTAKKGFHLNLQRYFFRVKYKFHLKIKST